MKTLRTFCILGLISAALPVAARQLSPEQALDRALAPAAQGTKRLVSNSSKYKLLHTARSVNGDTPTFYVFGPGNSDGFVITAADDRLAPVIGVCDSGAFEDIPDNMKWWLGQYDAEISEYYESNPESTAATVITPDDNYVDWTPIEPMVKTLWDQGAPYNDLCPTVNGQKTVTGCVATALAQVVRTIGYYKGEFSISYSNQNLGWSLTWDFGKYKPDFANMKDSYSGSNTAEEIKAVAELMMACGIAVNSNYNVASANGTGATYKLDNIKTYLGYTESFAVQRSGMSTAEWESLCYEILKAGKPICYGGSGSGGHAFVCDGYSDNGMFHFNWGWSGRSNGYFRLSALNPRNQGVGSFEGGYSLSQYMTVLVTPDDKLYMPDLRPGVVKWRSDIAAGQLKAPEVKDNDMSFDFMYQVTSTVYGSMIEVGIGLLLKNRDSNGEDVVVRPDAYRQMWNSSTQYNFTVTVPDGALERGAVYDAYPIYFCKGYNGFWKVEPTTSVVMDHYLISVDDKGEISAIVTSVADPGVDAYDMEVNDFYSTDNKNEFKCLVVNHSADDFGEALVLRIVNPKTGAKVLDIATSYLMICSGETLPLEATFTTNNVEPGTYELMLCRASSGVPLSAKSRMPVEIKAGKRPEPSTDKVPGPSDTYEVALWVDGKQQALAPISVLAGEKFSATTSIIAPFSQHVDYSLAFYNHGDLNRVIAKFPIANTDIKGTGSWTKGTDFTIEPGLGVGAYTMAFINQHEGLVSYTTDFLVGIEEDGIIYNYDAAANGLVVAGHSAAIPTELEIPADVKSVPVVGVADGAFTGCRQMEALALSPAIKTIGINAFRGASSLRHVKFTASDCPFANVAVGFHGVNPSAEFYVPSESFAAYKPAFSYRGRLYASIKTLSLPYEAEAIVGHPLELNAVVAPAENINPRFNVEVSDPEVLTATFDGKKLSIDPLKVGHATVTLSSAEPDVAPAKVEIAVAAGPEVSISEITTTEKAEYFDLSGRRVINPRGVVIERRGSTTTKIRRNFEF